MYDAINTLTSKERERQGLAALIEQYAAAGNNIDRLPGYEPAPKPIRRNHIDPDTVLHRRRRGLSALDRQRIRDMTEAL